VSRCDGGTKENPCNNEEKYTLEWVIEDVHLCQKHYDNEDNAKILREQIASDIKAFIDSVDLYEDQDLIDIVRGKNV
jgi:hypothetical protein